MTGTDSWYHSACLLYKLCSYDAHYSFINTFSKTLSTNSMILQGLQWSLAPVLRSSERLISPSRKLRQYHTCSKVLK